MHAGRIFTAGPRRAVTCLLSTLGVLGLAAAAPPVAPLASAVPAQAGNYGTIKGRLVWGGSPVAPKVLVPEGKAPKDPMVCATKGAIVDKDLAVDPKTKGIAHAIAYLAKASGSNPEAEKALLAKSAEVVIDQENCEFVPYSSAFHQKQKVAFKSSDPVNHNVRYSAFTNAPFNQIIPPNGQVAVNLVAERRPLPLACDIHPWMKGYMMVFDHPFFAVTKEDGSFEITGVPAGDQMFVIWQPAKGYVTEGRNRGMKVTVKPGEALDLGEIVVK